MRLPVRLLAAVTALTLAAAPAASAAPGRAVAPDDGWTVLRTGAPVSARAAHAVRTGSATTPSRYVVEPVDLDDDQRAAVARATAVLAGDLASTVPLRVRVSAVDLPSGVLATTAPGTWALRDRDGRHDATDTLYPVGLANALAGRDLDPDRPDVLVSISRTAPFWSGSETAPGDRYDLTSLVLRELVHGLGLTSTLRVEGGVGRYGDPLDSAPTPAVLDRLLVDGAGTPLLRRASGSAALGAALTSPVYWDGPQARAVAGRRPLLASPSTSTPGTSLVDLDEAAWPAGSPEAVLTPALAPGETARTLGPLSLALLADLGWPVPGLPGSRFTPVDPVRLLDTRTGLGQGGTRRTVGPGGVVDLQVAGRAGVPADAVAVVLGVTGVAPSRSTDVRVYPTPRTAEAVPEVSSLNLVRGSTRSGSVTVPLGRGGRVRLRNTSGTVSLLADLQGWYGRSGTSAYHPLRPLRLLDTRDTRSRTLGAGGTRDLVVAGLGPVPADATAVVLTLTGIGASRPTDVRVYPTGSARVPVVSTLNLRPGPPVAGLAVVRVGTGGRVRLRNAAGRAAVLVDLAGYFDRSGPGGQTFRPVTPTRVLDTRTTGRPRLGPGGTVDVALTGRGGVPAGATAAVLTLTGIAASASTDLRTYPRPEGPVGALPLISTLNLGRGTTTAAGTVVRLGDDGVTRVRNQSGSVAVALDVAGWFGP